MRMKRLLLAALCCVAPQAALATELEPGEWEFTSISTSRLFPGPQTATFRRCIRQEEAQNPDRWMADPGQSDCKVIPGAKKGDTYTWVMECAGAKMRGTGSARLSRTSMEGETNMAGEVQGQKFELRTKVTGRRVGPCKG
jgi:hypothetical protein